MSRDSSSTPLLRAGSAAAGCPYLIRILVISKNGGSTMSLGSLLQSLPPTQKSVLLFEWNALLLNLGPLPNILPPVTEYYEEEMVSPFLILPISYLIFICPSCPSPPYIPPAFVFSRFNHHNLLRLSLSVGCCKALSSLWPLLALLLCLPISCPGVSAVSSEPQICAGTAFPAPAKEAVPFLATELHCLWTSWCPASGLLRKTCFSASWCPDYPGAGDYCSPEAGLFPLHC